MPSRRVSVASEREAGKQNFIGSESCRLQVKIGKDCKRSDPTSEAGLLVAFRQDVLAWHGFAVGFFYVLFQPKFRTPTHKKLKPRICAPKYFRS